MLNTIRPPSTEHRENSSDRIDGDRVKLRTGRTISEFVENCRYEECGGVSSSGNANVDDGTRSMLVIRTSGMSGRCTYPHQIFQSLKIRLRAGRSRVSILATPEFPSLAKRKAIRAFSLALRNLASSGQSAMRKNPAIATAMVASPSMMKILRESVYLQNAEENELTISIQLHHPFYSS